MGAKQAALRGFLVTILLCVSTWSHPAYSQSQGQKAVYGSSGGVTNSTVWIDASAWWDQSTTTNPDLCTIINTIISGIITSGSTAGVVIDARGLYNSTGSGGASVICTGTPFPSSSSLFAMTILLPAAAIPVSVTWTLPNNTRLVGEGQNTRLVAQSGFSSSTYMIEMGGTGVCPVVSSVPVCTSVGVEHLLLSDSKQTGVGGIDNQFSTNSSYVDDVNLNSFNNIGLHVTAADSGPYSNLAFGSAAPGSGLNGPGPECIDLEAQTLGIHGVTCTGNSTTGTTLGSAAIYVNASNNSIEDVHIEAFWNGIEVGNIPSGMVGNIVISNVTGTKSGSSCGSGTQCHVTNVVHICGISPNSTDVCANIGTTQTAEDVTILNVMGYSATNNSSDVFATVRDDATGTAIVRCEPSCAMPLTTAMYALGESYDGGFPRFATNPSNPGTNYDSTSTFVPTWSAGSLSSTITGQSCLTPGAMYSNTSGGSMTSVFVCTYNGTTYWWKAIA